MNFKKIITSAVLSASILTCGVADIVMDNSSVAYAYQSHEERLMEAIIVDAIIEAERDRRAYERYDRYDNSYYDGYYDGYYDSYYDDYDYYYGYR